MRSILTLSVPPKMLKSLKRKAKRKGVSVSYYVRVVLEHEENIISEKELLARCKEAEKNYREGKTKVLRSLTDLL